MSFFSLSFFFFLLEKTVEHCKIIFMLWFPMLDIILCFYLFFPALEPPIITRSFLTLGTNCLFHLMCVSEFFGFFFGTVVRIPTE